MAINTNLPTVSIPQLDNSGLSNLDSRGADGAYLDPSEALPQSAGLSGDDLMGANVWGAGTKIVADQRALSGQALSPQDIANLIVIRG
jgi:hypothetical protein